MSVGVIVGNLGTPQSPQRKDVAPYLSQFLMDPYVIDVPWLLRYFLVKGIIVPFRSSKSAKAYQSIWSKERGSPLMFHTEDLCEALQQDLGEDFKVVPGMRYGEPSIDRALRDLSECSTVLALPLYPQYAESSYLTWVEEAKQKAKDLGREVIFLPPFFDQGAYLDLMSEQIKSHLDGKDWTHLLMSYHGLPNSHVQKTDLSGEHCLKKDNCCAELKEVNKNCYRAQCFETSRQLAKRMGLSESQYTVSFQSRLTKKWIGPATDIIINDLVKEHKRLAIITPAFTADCLETVEEIAEELREDFESIGGEDLLVVPCLNSDKDWVKLLSQWVKQLETNRGLS